MPVEVTTRRFSMGAELADGVSMLGRDAAAGLGCLFEWVIIVAYFGAAFLLHSWIMAAAPFALALVVIAWAYIWSRLDDH